VLARPADEIALLEVHEAIDGPLSSDECLLGAPVCRRDECILGDLLTRVTTQVTEYLSSTSLAEVVAGRERE